MKRRDSALLPSVETTFQSLGPELPAHRQNGAELNNHFKSLAPLIIEIEKISHQNQMACTRDWQKLGEALNHPQNECFS